MKSFISGTVRQMEKLLIVLQVEQCGCGLYNDCVLLEALGSAPIRASRMFGSYRKQIHVHQNVLVYYKGVPNKKNLKKFMSLVEK